QADQGMETPAELWFTHARAALEAGYPHIAITSATRYLQEAGREGQDYGSALALLDEAIGRAEGPSRRRAVASVYASTLGTGLSLGSDPVPSFSVRAVGNWAKLRRGGIVVRGNEYAVNLQLLSAGLLGDWQPFENGFRVTVGGLFNVNELSLATGALDLDLGGGSYRGTLATTLAFNVMAPYLGTGWASGRGRGRGFGWFIDAGVLFQGAPQLSGSGMAEFEGASCSFSLSESGRATVQAGCGLPELAADLETEHSDLEHGLRVLRFYPVLTTGVTWRF
ncbi:MAG: hypothetical protein OXE73_00575, partial [Gammaproteobacteria bacterium]|nr:hypothetical protein [Gammaproteobacteria bacterium]